MNKVTEYLLPLVSWHPSPSFSYTVLKAMGFQMCYLDIDLKKKSYEDCLFLLFKMSEETIENWDLFIDSIKVDDGFVEDIEISYLYRVIVMKIHPKYVKFPQYLLAGKYSWLGSDFAKNFISNNKGKKTVMKQYEVINRFPSYRRRLEEELDVEIDLSDELDSIPNIEEETLYTSKLIMETKQEIKEYE